MLQLSNQLILLIVTQVWRRLTRVATLKRSGRSQNRRLQKGLPA
jgi:hypothetical protein